MGIEVGKTACPKCREEGNDTSGDNLKIFQDEDGSPAGAYCFACDYKVLPDNFDPSKYNSGENLEKQKERKLSKIEKNKITKEENEEVKSITFFPDRHRAIKKNTFRAYGVRFSQDENDKLLEQFYPNTKDGQLVGYKIRTLPKDFSQAPIGVFNDQCDMFGSHLAEKCSKHSIVIAGGENDALAGYQMLLDYQKQNGKTNYDPTLVVSSCVGEGSAYKQIRANYEFFSQYKKIIVALDNDAAGRKGVEKILRILPKNKVFIMNMRHGDCHEYLEKGDQSGFISDFFNARPYTPEGVYCAADLYNEALDFVSQSRISLPDFMVEVNDKLCGGVVRGSIVIVAGGTSSGKTTINDQMTAEWIMNSDERICVLSLEASAGQYSTNLLSYASGIRFAKIRNQEDRVAMMMSKKAVEASDRLYKRDDEQRLWVIDDRGAELNHVQDRVEEIVKSMGVTMLIIDVTSDLLDGLSLSEAQDHMSWQKKFTKETGVTIVNVVHLRKTASGNKSYSQGALPTEDDLMGTSSLQKSASLIILIGRDKLHDDEIIRNSPVIIIPKNRGVGDTGKAGALYYIGDEHKLVNFKEHHGMEYDEYVAQWELANE